MPETKVCSRCKRSLPADKLHFYPASNTKDKFHSACKECEGHRFTQPRVMKNGYMICCKCGKGFPSTSEYFSKKKTAKSGLNGRCKSCESSAHKAYYENNKSYILASVKRYREINKEERREYYRANKQRKLIMVKQWQRKNKVRRATNNRLWKAANMEKMRVYRQTRRARKENLPSSLTVEEWINIKAEFENRCAYCGKDTPLTQDHFIPLSKHGEYTRDNIIPACPSCNNGKNASNPFEWYPMQSFYSKGRESKILKHLGYKNNKQQLSLF